MSAIGGSKGKKMAVRQKFAAQPLYFPVILNRNSSFTWQLWAAVPERLHQQNFSLFFWHKVFFRF